MNLEEGAVQDVAWKITEGVLKQLQPHALTTYGKERIKQVAFPKDVFLGVDEGLCQAALVLWAVAEVLSAQEEAIRQSPDLSTVEGILVDNLHTNLTRKGATAAEQAVKALRTVLAQSPSLLDLVLGGLLRQSEPSLEELRRMEDNLECCTLRVIDQDHKGREIVSTAFMICSRGHVLTAAHVALQLGRRVRVGFCRSPAAGREGEQSGWATVVHLDKARDIAALALEEESWDCLYKDGLRPPEKIMLADADTLRGKSVLCLGYKEQDIFASPMWARLRVSPHYPERPVEFRDGTTQRCLVLVPDGDSSVHIGEGMSGGPILNLETGEIIALVVGRTRRVFQEWKGVWEELTSGVYGFGVLLSDVVKSWPEFRRCCLQGM
jgi:hypothetical protein